MKPSILTKLYISLGLALYLVAMPVKILANDNSLPQSPAETANDGCFPLDIIFLIDQSSSMNGYGGTPASDPLEQRKYAVEAVIDQLADIALDRCPNSAYRLAVVSYGTEARIDLQWSNIDPDTFEDAQNIRRLLKPKVVADDLGQTDPKLAFEEATNLFAQLPDAGQEIRKKVIIFITDGIPYTKNGNDTVQYIKELQSQVNEDFPFSRSLLELEQCIGGLRTQYGAIEDAPQDEVNNCIKKHNVNYKDYQNSTYIWMILLKSFQPYPRGLLETYENIAQNHAGEMVELRQNRNEIPTTFRTILSNLAGVKASLLQCGKFAVNPYLKRATLNIFKLDEQNAVTLAYSAGGKHYEITGGVSAQSGGFNVEEYYAFGANERYVFSAPYPGLWDLRADDCTGLDAYYEEAQIEVGYQEEAPTRWPEYDRPPYFDENKPLYFEIQMLDEAGNVVLQEEHPQFAVDIVMTVTLPDNTKETYKMEWVEEDRIFRATEPLRLPKQGTYRINVIGTTHKHEGEPAPINTESYSDVFSSSYRLFELKDYEISVFPVTPFQIKIVTPDDDADLGPVHKTLMQNGWSLPLSVRPIALRAQFLDEQGNPLTVNLNEVLSDPQNALVARVEDKAGKQANILLQPDPANPGMYQGEFSEFDSEGPLTLSVNLQSSYNEAYRPLNTSDVVTVHRSDPLLHREKFYVTTLSIILGLATLSAVLWWNGLRNPLHGELVFYVGTEEIVRFSVSTAKQMRRRYRKVIGKKRLGAYPDLMLKKIEVRWQRPLAAYQKRSHGKKNEALDDSGFVDAYFDASPEVSAHGGVTLKCWPSPKGRPYTVDLTPGMQMPYSSEESLLQVKYEP